MLDVNTRKTPSLPELMDAAQACEAAGHFAQARHWLQQCNEQLDELPANSKNIAAIQSTLWRLSPLWWANLQHGGLTLRRCRAQDADFFRRCFNDSVFSRQFNRQQPWRGDLGAALQQSGKLPPLKTGLLMWVVESSTLGPIGLASLSSLDTVNLRAELSIGFPGAVPPTLGTKATLMMLHFALVMMPFHKVYTYVYQDNPQALHNTIRLGFVHEGTLKDHFYMAPYGFVSVHMTGLTRSQLHESLYLKRLAKRKIGQDW
jgi:RimJ/RimL family protein N-acetyltransferase